MKVHQQGENIIIEVTPLEYERMNKVMQAHERNRIKALENYHKKHNTSYQKIINISMPSMESLKVSQ